MDEQWRSAGCLGIRSSCRVETRATGSRSAAKAVARDQRLMQSAATRSTRRARRRMLSPNIGTLHSRVRGTSRWCRSNRAWCDDSFAVPDLCIQRDARFHGDLGRGLPDVDRQLHASLNNARMLDGMNFLRHPVIALVAFVLALTEIREATIHVLSPRPANQQFSMGWDGWGWGVEGAARGG